MKTMILAILETTTMRYTKPELKHQRHVGQTQYNGESQKYGLLWRKMRLWHGDCKRKTTEGFKTGVAAMHYVIKTVIERQ